MSSRWPAVVDYLLNLLPTLPGWSQVDVYDTDPITSYAPAAYAVVARTPDGSTSGSYVRSTNINGFMVDESGTVVVQIVTRTGDADPAGMRIAGSALADAMEDALLADKTLGGVLGQVGTVAMAVVIQPFSDQNGTGQSLVVSVTYTALT